GTYGAVAATEIKGGNIKAEEVVIGASSTSSNEMMMSNMSFKEFESLLFELPPIQMDEMLWS
ncbi:hypothetical protein A2U01_0067874, partial [Trifolium medium]|nr:hypothetical protein [Trifolium medium]